MGGWGLCLQRTFICTTFSKKPDSKSHRNRDVPLKSSAQQPFPFPLRTSRTIPNRPCSCKGGASAAFQEIFTIVERFLHKVLQESTITSSENPRLCALPLSLDILNIFSPSYSPDFDSELWAIFNSYCPVSAFPALCFQRTIHGMCLTKLAHTFLLLGCSRSCPCLQWGSWAAECWMWR